MHRFFSSALKDRASSPSISTDPRAAGHAADRSLHLGTSAYVISAPADLASGEFTSSEEYTLGYA